MSIFPTFKLENYLSSREYTANFPLCSSDIETLTIGDLLELGSSADRSRWEHLSLGYTEPKGNPELLEEIAKQYPGLSSANIACFAGAEEAIFLFMRFVLSEADHAIVVRPCYQSLHEIPSSICSVSTVELDREKSWELNVDAVRAAVRSNTKLIVVNFPHNPTGAMINVAQQDELIEIARKQGAYLFSDEVYRFLEHDEANTLPPMAAQYERGVSLSVLSKAYGLAGLRIGWLVCQDESLLDQLMEQKYYTSICKQRSE